MSASGTSTDYPGFKAFWDAWPAHKRKADQAGCLRLWLANGCEPRAAEIVATVRAWAASEDWTKDGGQYIPAPLVWLRQRRYEAPAPVTVAPGVTYRHGQALIDGKFVC